MSCNFCDCLPVTLPLYDDMRQAVFAGPTATPDFQFAFDYLDKASFSGANSRYVKVYKVVVVIKLKRNPHAVLIA